MIDLTQSLLDAGLLHFGRFDDDGVICPFRLHIDMVASYPVVLRELAALGVRAVGERPFDRVLAASNAVPLGVALSQALDVPLVYSRGTDDAAVFDLVGAYDIGHPTLLVVNTLADLPSQWRLIASAKRVGLDVVTVLAVVDGVGQVDSSNVEVLTLLRLSDVVDDLVSRGRLPVGQAQTVKKWLDNESV